VPTNGARWHESFPACWQADRVFTMNHSTHHHSPRGGHKPSANSVQRHSMHAEKGLRRRRRRRRDRPLIRTRCGLSCESTTYKYSSPVFYRPAVPYCWKLRHTQWSHNYGAAEGLCIELYLSKFSSPRDPVLYCMTTFATELIPS
jgi:hypothetical protein